MDGNIDRLKHPDSNVAGRTMRIGINQDIQPGPFANKKITEIAEENTEKRLATCPFFIITSNGIRNKGTIAV